MTPFTQALSQIALLHEQEVQAAREEVAAHLSSKSQEVEELHTLSQSAIYESASSVSSGDVVVEESFNGIHPMFREAAPWAKSGGHHDRWRQLASNSNSFGPKHRAQSTLSRRSSNETMQMLADELALIKGWKSDNMIKRISDSKVVKLKSRSCRSISNTSSFDVMCSLMIVGNAVLMGISVDWSVQHFNEEEPFTLVLMDRLFTAWFLFELLMRICGNGLTFFFTKDNWSWNLFDFVVVFTDVLTTLIQVASKNGGSRDVSIARLLLVLKITRTMRIVRIFRFFRELRMMVFSVLRSGTSVVWSMVLFFLDMFVFSIYFTQQVTAHLKDVKEHTELEVQLLKHFGSMPTALYTLLMSVSGGLNWGEVSTPLLQVHWSNAVVYVLFVFFTIYALTNIITGIFVDTAIQSAQSDRDEVICQQLQNRYSTLQQMRELFVETDKDGSGYITLKELERHLSDKRVRAHMMALGLQLDEARGLFRLLDLNKSGMLTIDEFIFGCMRLKGNARSIDLATLMYENKKMFTMFASFFDYVECEFGKLDFISRVLASREGFVHHVCGTRQHDEPTASVKRRPEPRHVVGI